jgi:hypothetical protein
MRAGFRVDTGFRQAEALDRTTQHEMFLNDLIDVARVNVAVPHGFGIDNDHRPVFALIETAGLLARILFFSPASSMASLKAALRLLEPLGRQLGREADSSRSLVQMKRWCSKRGIWIGF